MDGWMDGAVFNVPMDSSRPTVLLFTLNVRPESLTLILASLGRLASRCVTYLGSTSVSFCKLSWQASAISIVSPSLIATPHTQEAVSH